MSIYTNTLTLLPSQEKASITHLFLWQSDVYATLGHSFRDVNCVP